MSERSQKLKQDLDSLMSEWMPGDEGRILIRATAADHKKALEMADGLPNKTLLADCGIVVAGVLAGALVQAGKRPADYWQDADIPEALASKLSKALSDDPEAFVTAVRATLKGGG